MKESISKEIVSKVLEAEGLFRNSVYHEGMTPDDFSEVEYLEEVHKIVNNPEEQKRIKEELDY